MVELNIQIKREELLSTYTGMQQQKKSDLLIKKAIDGGVEKFIHDEANTCKDKFINKSIDDGVRSSSMTDSWCN